MMETVKELRVEIQREGEKKGNGHRGDKGNTSENEVKEAKEDK